MKQIRLFRNTILFGYILIAILVGSVAYTSFYEWQKLEGLEEENRQIDKFRLQLHDAYVRMIELSLLGETLLEWDADDLVSYHAQRISLDSMLCQLKLAYPSERIDSLRMLLEDKETQMQGILQVLEEQDAINRKIAEQVPVIVQTTKQEEPTKPKRKGLRGLFGKKEKPKQITTTKVVYTFNREAVAQQRLQSRRLSEQADSLAARNGELNRQLQTLISQMDAKVYDELQIREAEIIAMRENSYVLVGGMTSFIIFLLLISYMIIHSNNRRINRYKKDSDILIKKKDHAVREKNELIASRKKAVHTIVHELRTPLTAIKGYTELIHGQESAETNHHSGNILQETQRMTTMLNALLEFFRLDNGKEQLNKAPFRLRDVSDIFNVEFRPQAEGKDLNLIIECTSDVILMGDKERIMQIGNNLLSNAIKFTQSGNIALHLNYENGNLTMVVEDTGNGMTEEERERIFQPFERLSNAATQDGFGLGLSIVKRITDMQKGSIRVESEKGNGSRFTVTIPMPVADAMTAQAEQPKKLRLERTCSVAVLDDNEVLQNMMKDMYASVGVQCDTFGSVGDMMEAMRTYRYDLTIVDLKMPEVNGLEVLELMRSSSIGNSKEIPVIVATASGSCEAEELVSQGFSACLFKPFSLSELMAVSEKCLSVNADKEEIPDLTPLLAYSDKGMMLDRLIIETEKDMQEVKDAGARGDHKVLGQIVHRLRSSWSLMHADQPLGELQRLLYQEAECSEAGLQRAVSAILEKGCQIIRIANEEKNKPNEDLCN